MMESDQDEFAVLDTACTRTSVPGEILTGWGDDYTTVTGECLSVANGDELEVIGTGTRILSLLPPISL